MNDWDPASWSALADMILAIGLVAGGLWAIFTFWKAQRIESARWLHSILQDFYISEKFNTIRDKVEYEYDAVVAPLLERRLFNSEIEPSKVEVEILRELDTLLNYFENLIHLEHKGAISKKDRLVLFQYWFELICEPDKGALRRYLANYGWERVTKNICANRHDYIALYGSLREGQKAYSQLGLEEALERVGECSIAGSLYDLGEYPGLKTNGERTVKAELYRIKDPRVFAKLDDYERFNPRERSSSLYIRKIIRLADQDRDAWVYVYNQDLSQKELIQSGDWVKYINKHEPIVT
jgi:gamma-glutamylcyclotransferase (GGCT)/AIG2-like uncharacterized protein YtfP